MERRTYVQTAGSIAAGGAIGLSGCIGALDSGPDSLVFGFTPNTSFYSFLQGFAAMVNENTDQVEVSVQPVEANNAAPRMLAEDDIDIGTVSNWTIQRIINGEEPFGDIDAEYYQLFNVFDLMWTYMTNHGEWETIEDIESGSQVSPGPRGSSSATMLLYVLEEYGGLSDYVRANVGFTEQATAFSEDRLDIGSFSFTNGPFLPAWMQEATSAVDVTVLDIPDSIVSQLESDERVRMFSIEPPSDMRESFANIPESVPTPTGVFNFIATSEESYEPLREFLTVGFENRSGLADVHQMGNFYSSEGYWVKNPFNNVPFHPAAADLYEEKGLWKDEYERGDQ
ncbi:TAXI family TRAP transporter solute-binding subunit [Natronomonas marina]|jgi:TRAP-type uncharacterized transport system substrate-binding protein|uniref:TAXI family TRAP transporter solute-binding subunit n=1 Tax=Natronomonas marina TaxID=2961939 RepID=UPI0020C95F66|nr:TAXI family TRAP transporter solute-binding subunit [Natronomonas marina]